MPFAATKVDRALTSVATLLVHSQWAKGGKKVKQAKLGEENNMYYHPEVSARWASRDGPLVTPRKACEAPFVSTAPPH